MEDGKTLIVIVAVVAIVAIFSIVSVTKQRSVVPMMESTMQPIVNTPTEPSANMAGQASALNSLTYYNCYYRYPVTKSIDDDQVEITERDGRILAICDITLTPEQCCLRYIPQGATLIEAVVSVPWGPNIITLD